MTSGLCQMASLELCSKLLKLMAIFLYHDGIIKGAFENYAVEHNCVNNHIGYVLSYFWCRKLFLIHTFHVKPS